VAPSKAKPFVVDRRELPGYPIIPEVGSRATLGFYDPPEWTLTGVTDLRAVHPARIHGVDGVEIEVRDHEWDAGAGWTSNAWTMFACLTEQTVGWLGTLRVDESGARELYTFLDEGFDDDWGEGARRLKDRGRFIRQKDGSYKLRKSRRQPPEEVGAGMFRVKIGGRAFTCLRVVYVDTDGDDGASDKGILYESYLTRGGRTVLGRRYNGRLWGLGRQSPFDGPPWDERFPDNARIVIDGVTFVHWYDVLSERALGAVKRR